MMYARVLDHRTDEAGGRSVSGPRVAEAGGTAETPGAAAAPHAVETRHLPEALLALEDGTLWRGEAVGSHGPVSGLVRRLGDLVIVEGDRVAVLRHVRPVTFGALLDATLAADRERPIRGFVTAAGATLPLHGRVASAIARGEIGRP
jgi:hypothetical protein